MIAITWKASGSSETHSLPLRPGPHRAVDLEGMPPGAFDLEVATTSVVLIPRIEGFLAAATPLPIGERRLLLPGLPVEREGILLSVEKPAPHEDALEKTAALAQSVLCGALDGSGPTRLPSLVWLNGRDCGRRLPLMDKATTLGRGEDVAARIRDPRVSRLHARLLLGPEVAWIEHLSSANGLSVNGKAVETRRALYGGDVLRLGDTELLFDAAIERPAPAAVTCEPKPAEPEPASPRRIRASMPGLLETIIVAAASIAGAAATVALWWLAG